MASAQQNNGDNNQGAKRQQDQSEQYGQNKKTRLDSSLKEFQDNIMAIVNAASKSPALRDNVLDKINDEFQRVAEMSRTYRHLVAGNAQGCSSALERTSHSATVAPFLQKRPRSSQLGPPVAPLTLQPSNSENRNGIILGFLVEKISGKKFYVVGCKTNPLSRIRVKVEDVRKYVSARTHEDWEYSQTVELDKKDREWFKPHVEAQKKAAERKGKSSPCVGPRSRRSVMRAPEGHSSISSSAESCRPPEAFEPTIPLSLDPHEVFNRRKFFDKIQKVEELINGPKDTSSSTSSTSTRTTRSSSKAKVSHSTSSRQPQNRVSKTTSTRSSGRRSATTRRNFALIKGTEVMLADLIDIEKMGRGLLDCMPPSAIFRTSIPGGYTPSGPADPLRKRRKITAAPDSVAKILQNSVSLSSKPIKVAESLPAVAQPEKSTPKEEGEEPNTGSPADTDILVGVLAKESSLQESGSEELKAEEPMNNDQNSRDAVCGNLVSEAPILSQVDNASISEPKEEVEDSGNEALPTNLDTQLKPSTNGNASAEVESETVKPMAAKEEEVTLEDIPQHADSKSDMDNESSVMMVNESSDNAIISLLSDDEEGKVDEVTKENSDDKVVISLLSDDEDDDIDEHVKQEIVAESPKVIILPSCLPLKVDCSDGPPEALDTIIAESLLTSESAKLREIFHMKHTGEVADPQDQVLHIPAQRKSSPPNRNGYEILNWMALVWIKFQNKFESNDSNMAGWNLLVGFGPSFHYELYGALILWIKWLKSDKNPVVFAEIDKKDKLIGVILSLYLQLDDPEFANQLWSLHRNARTKCFWCGSKGHLESACNVANILTPTQQVQFIKDYLKKNAKQK